MLVFVGIGFVGNNCVLYRWFIIVDFFVEKWL